MTPDARPGTTATDGIGARRVRQRAKLRLRLAVRRSAFVRRERGPKPVEQLVELSPVDPHLVGERDGLRVVNQLVELVEQRRHF